MPRGSIATDGTVTITYNPGNGDKLLVGDDLQILPCACCGRLTTVELNVVSVTCMWCMSAREKDDEALGWPAGCVACGASGSVPEGTDTCSSCGWSPTFARMAGDDDGPSYTRNAHPSVGGESE